MNLAIIGGTGYQKVIGNEAARLSVETSYGTVIVFEQEHNSDTIYYLLRHGEGHRVPPHLINYRAIIDALSALHVTHAIGLYAVGSITSLVLPGTIGLIDQFIDFTGGGRDSTFFTGDEKGVKHIPMVTPYSVHLRKVIIETATHLDIPLCKRGTYVCTNGPRLETPAEITMFRRWGADYVGMTAATETILAAEAGIQFAGLVYSINWAAGLDAEGISFLEEETAARVTTTLLSLAQKSLLAVGA